MIVYFAAGVKEVKTEITWWFLKFLCIVWVNYSVLVWLILFDTKYCVSDGFQFRRINSVWTSYHNRRRIGCRCGNKMNWVQTTPSAISWSVRWFASSLSSRSPSLLRPENLQYPQCVYFCFRPFRLLIFTCRHFLVNTSEIPGLFEFHGETDLAEILHFSDWASR